MENKTTAPKHPFSVELEAGKKYAWCSCGKSSSQPFCDGSHRGTPMKPIVFTVEAAETVFLCGCKATEKAPFCDGSHQQAKR